MESVDCLLVKSAKACAPGSVQRWLEVANVPGIRQAQPRCVSTRAAENGAPMRHLYLMLDAPLTLSAEDVIQLSKVWHALTGNTVVMSRLRKVLDLPGAAPNAEALAHYVVETDPEDGWGDEIAQWYAEEHLPGLARVPGCIVAQRYINLDHSPSSFACYDLASPEVLNSPEWLAIRGTPWSDRCRPHFTNTLRTLFEHIHPLTF
jgi:hypothetical protein